MKSDLRFAKGAGREIFTGNELLVKGAMEAERGVGLLTGCPGFPFSGYFQTLHELAPMLAQKGVVAQPACDEAMTVQSVHRAEQASGRRAMIVISCRGLQHVGEALAAGVRAGSNGGDGGLIVCGDDPSGESSDAAVDPRLLAEQLFMPMVAPATPQEIKDWVNLALALGRSGKTYIGYLLTAAAVDGGGSVDCQPNQFPPGHTDKKESLVYDRDGKWPMDRSVGRSKFDRRQRIVGQRFELVAAEARRLGLNRIMDRPHKGETVPLGFIAAGAAAASLTAALAQIGLAGRLPVLKLGLVYPIDGQIVTEFAHQCRSIVVVEQGRNFVERQVQQILWPLLQTSQWDGRVDGKQFPNNLPGIPTEGRLNASILIDRLVPMIKNHPGLAGQPTNGHLTTEFDRIQRTGRVKIDLPQRTSTFCTGCPHRDSSSVLLELRADLRDSHYMLENHKRSPVDLIVHGEGGCHSLLSHPPYESLINGDSDKSIARGDTELVIEKKQIAFLEDGQFFRDGRAAMEHAIQTGQDMTYLILGSPTTAMTDPQPAQGVDGDGLGRPATAKAMERRIQDMFAKSKGAASVVRIDPTDRKRYRRLLEQMVLSNGLKVVVVDKECGITRYRRVTDAQSRVCREEGYLPLKTYMNIATEVCENCYECGRQTACPALRVVETDYGPKVQTDQSACVNDGACQRIDACPAFEQITVIRKKPLRRDEPRIDVAKLPQQPRPIHADQRSWRCHVAGVGGSGVRSCSRVLATAGGVMGYDVQFLNEKGIAVRSGGVYSQLLFTRCDSSESRLGPTSEVAKLGSMETAAIPYGGADLVLGIDLLEAVRSVDGGDDFRVSVPEHTAAVVNTARSQTTRSLMGLEEIDSDSLETALQRAIHPMRYFGLNVSDLCQRILGSTRYTPTMLLGIAYQQGYLPVTLGAIQQAIDLQFDGDIQNNFRAFDIGRKVTQQGHWLRDQMGRKDETARRAVRRKINALRSRFRGGRRSERQVRQLRILLRKVLRITKSHQLDDALIRDVVVRTYDCLVWGGAGYAQQYCNRVIRILKKDSADRNYAVTRAVVWNLARVMLIKDEVYVASLLTTPEKFKQDRLRFQVNPADGDRISYRYDHRLHFKLLGRRVGIEWSSRLWQLRVLSRMRFLRDLVPGWHRRQRAFRDWYEGLVDRFDWESSKGAREYQRWLVVLSSPETVSGYRHVRDPKMEAARLRAEQLLATDSALFEPDGVVFAQNKRAVPRTVRLPVLAAVGGSNH